jgi:hypothetical protein
MALTCLLAPALKGLDVLLGRTELPRPLLHAAVLDELHDVGAFKCVARCGRSLCWKRELTAPARRTVAQGGIFSTDPTVSPFATANRAYVKVRTRCGYRGPLVRADTSRYPFCYPVLF